MYDYFQNKLKSEQNPIVEDVKNSSEPSTIKASTVAELELKWAAEFSKDNDFIRQLEPELNKVMNELNIGNYNKGFRYFSKKNSRSANIATLIW